MEQVTIQQAGKDPISATLWPAANAKAVILIHPATAVPQDFYLLFAEHLNSLGFVVLTYDYRGIGRSCQKDIRQYKVSMSDWMLEDAVYVTDWLAERFQGLPLLALGHSVGGHAIAISPATRSVHAAVMIASHAGITALIQPLMERVKVGLIMRVLTPVLCRLCGYMPSRRLGFGENLPRGVMQQWSRWTQKPHYFYDDPPLNAKERASRVDIPLLVLGFDDDPWANPQAISRLLEPLSNAPIERLHLKHKKLGLPHIGHMGFFRKRNAEALWPIVVDWLVAQSESSSRSNS
ncbi:alpha/beta hydrolase family protein [Alcaligenes parafaecalis]|uniref:Alpha/beta fold hydrolase n=1 Tax=Alcaligenes parafaecalis TaxID=171260 RepID=A0ABT3VL96_9BURK|nr:alpha/beta fold hydrolase [Alcaligenes parafaecalis]MCX5463015.1 alpha/beta fold hydrolase [Alcaligenes parafaecalis]